METAATITTLVDYRRTKVREEVRSKLHEDFDRWLDTIEEAMEKKNPPTLAEITQAVFQKRQELMGKISENLVNNAHEENIEQEWAKCPDCGRLLKARPKEKRSVETMVGEVHLERPYFYCKECQHGFHPLDEALSLSEKRKQDDVRKALVNLSKEIPYETASELFEELTGIEASSHIAHEATNEVALKLGVLDVAPSREEIAARIEEVGRGKKWRPIVVLGIDGANLPIRPEEAKKGRRGRKKVRARRARWKGRYREAKGFRFYLVDEDRIVHLLSWHQVQDDKELLAALEQVQAAGLIPEEKIRLCVVADGARWIWNRVRQLFPSAREILDYYHCSEYIHDIAEAQYGRCPQKALEWTEATMARLFCNEVEAVIWGLQRMKPADDLAQKQIKSGIGYLQNNRERLDYGSARKGGYPLGSGGIESANKFICHVRLKRSGAWWYVENGNKMLALRCAKYNGTFDRLFERGKK